MPSLPILDRTGKEVGTYEIELADLAPRINKQLLHDAVVMYQANLRQGTAKTKNRTDVRGTTKKMYRQKGTGNARAGSRRSGIRRGGGHMKQKLPQDWSYRMPRKALQLATRMALASKIKDNQVVLVDDLKFEQPRTKEMLGILKACGCGGTSLLVTTNGYDVNVYKSARNIDRVSVSPVGELNAYSLLRPRRVLITRSALDAIREKAQAAAKTGEEAAE